MRILKVEAVQTQYTLNIWRASREIWSWEEKKWYANVANMSKNKLAIVRVRTQIRQWHPTPVLLSGKSHGQRSLVGSVHGVTKSRTRLSIFIFTFHFHGLEKEMATHSSVLAWRIPGTGEPGGLPSMGSHRVRHDWSDLAAAEQEPERARSQKRDWDREKEREGEKSNRDK